MAKNRDISHDTAPLNLRNPHAEETKFYRMTKCKFKPLNLQLTPAKVALLSKIISYRSLEKSIKGKNNCLVSHQESTPYKMINLFTQLANKSCKDGRSAECEIKCHANVSLHIAVNAGIFLRRILGYGKRRSVGASKHEDICSLVNNDLTRNKKNLSIPSHLLISITTPQLSSF